MSITTKIRGGLSDRRFGVLGSWIAGFGSNAISILQQLSQSLLCDFDGH